MKSVIAGPALPYEGHRYAEALHCPPDGGGARDLPGCHPPAQRLERAGASAQVLLQADADGPGWTDRAIAAAFSCRVKTVENIRQRCVLEGFTRRWNASSAPRHRRRRFSTASPRRGSSPCVWGHRRRGTRTGVCGCWRTTCAGDCRVGEPRNAATDAKKNGMCQRKIAYWVIPPDADAEFAAHMEEVKPTLGPWIAIVRCCAWTNSLYS